MASPEPFDPRRAIAACIAAALQEANHIKPDEEWAAHVELVLLAMARALYRNTDTPLRDLATVARDALNQGEMRGAPLGDEFTVNGVSVPVDRHNVHALGVGVDEFTAIRFIIAAVESLVERPKDDPPILRPRLAAHALSRALGSGPLRAWYTSAWTPARDGDAERILSAWSQHIDGRGMIGLFDVDVGGDEREAVRKLIVAGLLALGVDRARVKDRFSKKALGGGKKVVSSRARR